MNYGLYLSASGVLTSMHRQDVFANNLANAQTAGFKRDLADIRQRDAQSMEKPADRSFRNVLLDKIGGGSWAAATRTSFEPGPLQITNAPLDVALTDGESFFAVRAPGEGGKDTVHLTRDGRFSRSADGQLVTAAGRHPVLDRGDSPITLDSESPVSITSDGNVVQNGGVVAQLQVTGVKDTAALHKEGQNLFSVKPSDRRAVELVKIQTGAIEGSSVDPIRALMELNSAGRDVSFNSELIKYHDLLLDRAVNVLGKVA